MKFRSLFRVVALQNGYLLTAWFYGSGERKSDDVCKMGGRKMASYLFFLLRMGTFLVVLCGPAHELKAQATHESFLQAYAVKYYAEGEQKEPQGFSADRNGRIQWLSGHRLYKPDRGALLFPGKLCPDQLYRYDRFEKISAILNYQDEFVYLTDQSIYSNAWAGNLYLRHGLTDASKIAADQYFGFLIANKTDVQFINREGSRWKASIPGGDILGLLYDNRRKLFWCLSSTGVFCVDAEDKTINQVYAGRDLTCFALVKNASALLVGSSGGYAEFQLREGFVKMKRSISKWNRNLPCNQLLTINEIDGKYWFGSTEGVFCLRPDGRFDFYNGERWLPGNKVSAVIKGTGASVLVATDAGLSQLFFEPMSLPQKAVFYDNQVRLRHIRNGLNASFKGVKQGNLSLGNMQDSDNDGLWTAMYLAGEAFHYATNHDSSALYHCRESLKAMERLYSVNPVKGFPARSFERIGHKNDLSNQNVWLDASDSLWSWKSTTSSDEVIGHMFVFSVLAELVDDTGIRKKAVALMDSLMTHIVDHDLYLVDHDGKPTLWGKWNPDYVNQFPTNIGDRKLNSSNIISMLQSAYYFTKKEKFKEKALSLMNDHGYYENLIRPMKEIGQAAENADEKSRLLSDHWNHSDDEMYFLGYWGLYRYALNDTLKANFKKAILDHWQFEKPERDALWNFFAAMVGEKDYDLAGAKAFLQEYPLDLIEWSVINSNRKDIHLMPDNFMNQSTDKVLPASERPVHRHNRTTFILDQSKEGEDRTELSAGDIWLLPYWFGRYLQIL
ncbi:hypothetical protein SAMN05216436_11222 [bacterium A37T11]|nr:hypothetical protein SAMN05216436_11222 [bacterium A37T11]